MCYFDAFTEGVLPLVTLSLCVGYMSVQFLHFVVYDCIFFTYICSVFLDMF